MILEALFGGPLFVSACLAGSGRTILNEYMSRNAEVGRTRVQSSTFRWNMVREEFDRTADERVFTSITLEHLRDVPVIRTDRGWCQHV